jgi:hypothetical protein
MVLNLGHHLHLLLKVLRQDDVCDMRGVLVNANLEAAPAHRPLNSRVVIVLAQCRFQAVF